MHGERGQRLVELHPARLIEEALRRGEGELTDRGALAVRTGKYTGRSPRDKFFVEEPGSASQIDWGPVNQPFSQEAFERLEARIDAYLQNRDRFIFKGFAGADPRYQIPIRVTTEFAWHNLFARNLFIRPQGDEPTPSTPPFEVVVAPGFKADPSVDGTRSEAFVVIHLGRRRVLIGGTEYAGEIKKSLFSVLNYTLPQQGVLPMHCSANMGQDGDVALFFGLSGTGKTTLSTDPDRSLIGDDEHGWSANGIFNLEGGCYAKCIRLSRESEPQIWQAIRFGAVLENVVLDRVTRAPLYDSDQLTENTRAAYPIDHIADAVQPSVGGHPRTILFLTADAFGVLPPVARLDTDQAIYHFLSGYTSKLAGTERGVTEPEATFSTCFGAPFLPLPPQRYAEQLRERIDRHGTQVYLINTGWIGGPYGVGSRIPLKWTRAMVRAALSGELERVEYDVDPTFRIAVPRHVPDVSAEVLQPRKTWSDAGAYDRQARRLAQQFTENFTRFADARPELIQAGPRT